MRTGLRLCAAAAAFLALAPPAQAALYWFGGVRTTPIRVCFAGNALTARAPRVQQVREYLRGFGEAANIDLTGFGTCPPPATLPNGNHFYDGDIRVVLPGTNVDATRPVLGKGCDTDRLRSAPAAVAWGANRLDVFWRGWDDSLRHKWWNGSRWSGNENLSGALTSAPAVASWGVNRLDAFARGGDNAIWRRSWNGSGWEPWTSIGGSLASAPAAVSRAANRIDVFARGQDDAVWHNAWNGTSWSGWTSIGGTVTSAPAVASPGAERLAVFARGTDNAVWWNSWSGSTWSGWSSIGGAATSPPTAVSRAAGRSDVFIRGQGNDLRQNSWNGSSWSGWTSRGGVLASAPAVASWAADRLDVLYQGQNTALWTRVWNTTNTDPPTWKGESDIGENAGWGSWSNPPDDLEKRRSCLYNLKLGDDGKGGVPYRNHTLHEFGHALGLSHEHERADVDKSICSEPGFGGGATDGWMTPYDRRSVMHYAFSKCGIEGNYGYSGLSAFDRLGLHILYPEDDRVAELRGALVVPSNRPLILRSDWQARGANTGFVAKGWTWRIGGTVRSTTPQLEVSLPAGVHPLTLQHQDFLGRTYTLQGIVRVLAPSDYTRRIASLPATLSPLL